ncbi:hypothetical protein AALC25_18280 [Lachnospiraceae bacterium 29-84]
MEQLIAVSPVLFGNQNYEPGDRLPTHDAGLVEIWTGNGTAVWKGTDGPAGGPKKRRTKARQTAAPAGLPGDACPSAGQGQDLVGKTPPRKTRGAQPEPARGRRKSSA